MLSKMYFSPPESGEEPKIPVLKAGECQEITETSLVGFMFYLRQFTGNMSLVLSVAAQLVHWVGDLRIETHRKTPGVTKHFYIMEF